MDWFSHPFYRHVSLLAPLGDGACLYVEPMSHRVETYVYAQDVSTTVEELKSLGYVIIKYNHNLDDSKVRCKWNLIPSCVTVVKVFSGVSASVVSPWGLCKWLLKRNSRIM